MFRSPSSLLVLLLFACTAALLVFDQAPSDGTGRAVDSRGFLSVCEASPFAAANNPDMAEAARLCSCVLSWHLRQGEQAGYPLPAALYQSGESVVAVGEVSSLARSVDAKARGACRSGRLPR